MNETTHEVRAVSMVETDYDPGIITARCVCPLCATKHDKNLHTAVEGMTIRINS